MEAPLAMHWAHQSPGFALAGRCFFALPRCFDM